MNGLRYRAYQLTSRRPPDRREEFSALLEEIDSHGVKPVEVRFGSGFENWHHLEVTKVLPDVECLFNQPCGLYGIWFGYPDSAPSPVLAYDANPNTKLDETPEWRDEHEHERPDGKRRRPSRRRAPANLS